jgi:hypothetical protein
LKLSRCWASSTDGGEHDLNLLLDLHDGPHMGDRPTSASMISTKVCAA